MKVTCGACFRTLRVEDWLADNVGRCPKCNEVIQIPPRHSPDGAEAAVLTVDEATELLRRRASAGLIPSLGGEAPPAGAPPEPVPGAPRGPKTEPLPAFLKHAAKSIHEEPEHRKTRPLPRPTGRPSPVLTPRAAPAEPVAPAAGPSPARQEPPAERAPLEPAGRSTWLSPLVPVAFIVGLLVGAVVGWLIGRSSAGAPAQDSTVRQQNQVEQQPAPPPGDLAQRPAPPVPAEPIRSPIRPPVPPPVEPPPPPVEPVQPVQPTQPVEPVAPIPAPQFKRTDWLAAQPAGARATIDQGRVQVVRRVGGIGEPFPASRFYHPAPLGQVYLEVSVPVHWAAIEPVTFKLAGPQADCWLVCSDGRVFEPLGRPRQTLAAGPDDSPADPTADVTLDQTRRSATVTVLFLTPESLPASRLGLTASQFADLPAGSLSQDNAGQLPVDGPWQAIAGQSLAQDYAGQGAEHRLMAALAGAAKAGPTHRMAIAQRPGGGLEMRIDKARIVATLAPAAEKGCYEAMLDLVPAQTAGDSDSPAEPQDQAKATVRLFDGGRQLVIYFSADRYMQYAYQRYEESFPGGP